MSDKTLIDMEMPVRMRRASIPRQALLTHGDGVGLTRFNPAHWDRVHSAIQTREAYVDANATVILPSTLFRRAAHGSVWSRFWRWLGGWA